MCVNSLEYSASIAMPDWHLRAATSDDLAAAFAIYAQYEFGDRTGREVIPVPAYLPHLLETGRVIVAERAGAVVGFAAAATRGNVSFLADLFVRPEVQSGALGKALLCATLPASGVRCTCSTSDPARPESLHSRRDAADLAAISLAPSRDGGGAGRGCPDNDGNQCR